MLGVYTTSSGRLGPPSQVRAGGVAPEAAAGRCGSPVLVAAATECSATLLFIAGNVLYEISLGALGIFLATFTGTMGQFGLLVVPVILYLLSGSASRRGADQQQASFIVSLGNGREHLVGEVV
jgi:hypothetical protein